ncbi:hypothetical protein [Pseudomonas capsici]|uniref:hypothetical protein n=1 Tax=Pseudomonas capsici TaxID=2810614 RepID=UPI0021F1C376|nr:hypothetical protein [Pseudomonas capsici]MCV4261151.1 hypothetical protein [Pseudomonas capsici]
MVQPSVVFVGLAYSDGLHHWRCEPYCPCFKRVVEPVFQEVAAFDLEKDPVNQCLDTDFVRHRFSLESGHTSWSEDGRFYQAAAGASGGRGL